MINELIKKYEEFKNKEICCFDNNRIKDKINYEIYCKVGDEIDNG